MIRPKVFVAFVHKFLVWSGDPPDALVLGKGKGKTDLSPSRSLRKANPMNTSIASNWRPHSRALYAFLIAIAALWVMPRNAQAQRAMIHEAKLVQTNLVSDIPGLATITDPALKNPWGVSHSSTSPFWVSNQGTSTTTLYGITDETNVMKVT